MADQSGGTQVSFLKALKCDNGTYFPRNLLLIAIRLGMQLIYSLVLVKCKVICPPKRRSGFLN